jgi:predicted metal-dependent hydrolase
MQSEVVLKPRSRKFAFRTDVSSFWFDGDPFRTRFFDAFSTMLPVGEKFFIEALRRSQGALKDPKLAADVRLFIAQEATHGREHVRYNDRLRQYGIDIDAMDRSQKRVMWKILGFENERIPLAVTVALEHITAVLGAALLRGELFENCDPEMVAFWKWHAAEEIEHKGVAFDAYVDRGGGPNLRRLILGWAVFIVAVRMTSRMVHMLRKDGRLWDSAVWRSGARFMFGKKGFFRTMGAEFLDFFRADYHPWSHDDYALVKGWEADIDAMELARP